MPYTLEWLMPQQIVYVQFAKTLTSTELDHFDKETCQLFDTGNPQKVHLIANVQQLNQFPTLKQAQQLMFPQHLNYGWGVIVGNQNSLLRAIIMLIAAMFGNRLQWCSSREEALAFLQRTDKTLPELK